MEKEKIEKKAKPKTKKEISKKGNSKKANNSNKKKTNTANKVKSNKKKSNKSKKTNKNKLTNFTKRKKIIILSCLGFILIILIYVLYNFIMVSNLKSVEITNNGNKDDKMLIRILLNKQKFVINSDTWCFITLEKDPKDIVWTKAKNNKCEAEVREGNYYIYLKNRYGYVKRVATKDVDVNKIKNAVFSKNDFYIAVGGSEEFKVNLETYGFVDTSIKYKISDESVVKIENNKFIGLSKGDAIVEAIFSDNSSIKANVHVMDSITVPNIETNKNKNYVSCNQFSTEEAELLDRTLEDRINSAGYKTRAGAVAAARFLGLEFSYRVPYFYENGRLNNYDVIQHVDGEGRYYHKGLYLDESKFNSIEASYEGPAIWGCPLKNHMDEGRYKPGVKYPNGLDCSGYISWALYNGGFDIGDNGAGDNPYRDDDLYDLGELRNTSMELINSGEVKVGDLIAYWGHMAMIVGMDDNNLYIAESLPNTKGAVVKKYTKTYAMDLFENIMLMDSVYKEDGNLTNYWE